VGKPKFVSCRYLPPLECKFTPLTDNVKIHSPWAQLGLFLRWVGVAFLGLVVLALLFNQLPQPLSNNALKLEQIVSAILLFGVPAYLYARQTFTSNPLYHLGFRPAAKPNFYLLGILLLLAAFPLEGWLGIVNKRIPLPHWMITTEEATDKELTALLSIKNPFDIIINLLVVAVIPAIFEEMCFRGALQRMVIQLTRRPWTAIFITAFIFSFMHFQFQGFLPRLFLGLLLGAAYWYSGSLWTSILAHCFFNGIQVIALTYYPALVNNDNPTIPAYTVLMSGVIVILLLGYMRRQSSRVTSVNPSEWH
jgi:membrane protease YdiL (CAAX protease family)